MSVFTFDEIEASVCEAIAGAQIRNEPFPHLTVHGLWPTDFYTELTESLSFLSFVQRGAFGAGKTTMARALRSERTSWSWVQRILEGEPFQNILNACLHLEWMPGTYSRMLLHKDADGYMIAPHLDVLSKRITYLCYFASDTEHQALGTLFLKPKAGAWLENKRSGHQFWYDFDVVDDMPYLPNTFCAFVPGVQSWHAVDIRFAKDDPVQARYAIRGFVFEPDKPLPYIFAEDERERNFLRNAQIF